MNEYLKKQYDIDEITAKLSEFKYDISSENGITVIKIYKEKTAASRINYLMCNNMLMVFGNYGKAIYEFSESISINFFKDVELDYFAGKCVASPVGANYRNWDRHLVQQNFEEFLISYLKDEGIDQSPEEYMSQDCFQEYGNPLDIEYDDMCDDDKSWADWVRDTPFSNKELYDLGWRIDSNCVYHWIAIKLASEKPIDEAS